MTNNNREIILSISARPGSFGEIVHNEGYRIHKLNYFYKAVKVDDLEDTINALRILNVKGFSVSMPFKEKIVGLLNKIDKDALDAGAVNTVINENTVLKGFNTDIYGAERSLSKLQARPNNIILILGSGGVCRAILIALKNLKVKNVFIANRTKKKAVQLSKEFKCKTIEWTHRNDFKGDILINATPVGMGVDKKLPLLRRSIGNFKKIMDVVVRSSNTPLINEAKRCSIPFVSGTYMTFYQAAKQFKLYTGLNAPLKQMIVAYNKEFKQNFSLD